ncbi:MAG: hypothetical protein HOP27_02530 [Anaerolineales bacterium]|nr:hypothetical protein [Anaerolineales bacterium]
MSKIPDQLEEREDRKQIIRITKQNLVLSIIFLASICLVLGLRVGEALWPLWIVVHRTQIIGVILLAEFLLILLSPIIVEVNSNPRTLSGPGKNPNKQGWDP